MKKFITLTREDFSPAILRVDRIKKMRMMPGDRTEIIYGDGEIVTVRQSIDEVEEMTE